MNRVLTLAGIGVAAYVVWAAARVRAGARKRPRPTFVPYSPLVNMGGNTWTAARQ